MTTALISFGSFVGLLAGIGLLAVGGMRCAAEAEHRADVEAARTLARKVFDVDPLAARVLFDAASECDDPDCVQCGPLAAFAADLLAIRSLPETGRPA